MRQYEEELDAYIRSGQTDKGSSSALIRWFEGTLDESFYYSEMNDELLFASIQDEIGKLFRFDPSQENCFWFPLNRDKCISVWYCKDDCFGDRLAMKLERRADDGSMGPHCEILIDERFETDNLSHDAIYQTLLEIYDNADLNLVAESSGHELTDKIMSVFRLKKRALEEQIATAHSRTTEPSCLAPDAKGKEEGRD